MHIESIKPRKSYFYKPENIINMYLETSPINL